MSNDGTRHIAVTLSEIEFWKGLRRLPELEPEYLIASIPHNAIVNFLKLVPADDLVIGWWRRENRLVMYMSRPSSAEEAHWYVPFPIPIEPGIAAQVVAQFVAGRDYYPDRPGDNAIPVFSMQTHHIFFSEAEMWERPERVAVIIENGWMLPAGSVG